jgi:hypothetical protein
VCEALYGGAAGGGKSEALLMWLAEGIDIPHYSGIIFRRIEDDLTQFKRFAGRKGDAALWALGGVSSDSGKCWRFPSGAIIQLAGLNQEQSVLKHQGPSYHRIAFDELTHFTLSQYEFLGAQPHPQRAEFSDSHGSPRGQQPRRQRPFLGA